MRTLIIPAVVLASLLPQQTADQPPMARVDVATATAPGRVVSHPTLPLAYVILGDRLLAIDVAQGRVMATQADPQFAGTPSDPQRCFVAVSTDGATVWVLGGELVAYEAQTLRRLRSLGGSDPRFGGLACVPGGRLLVRQNESLSLQDGATGEILAMAYLETDGGNDLENLTGDWARSAMTVDATGAWMIWSDLDPYWNPIGRLARITITGSELTLDVPSESPVGAASALVSDGAWLWLAGQGSSAVLVQDGTGATMGSWPTGSSGVTGLGRTADGAWMWLQTRSGEVQRRQATTGTLAGSYASAFAGAVTGAQSLAVTSDGTVVRASSKGLGLIGRSTLRLDNAPTAVISMTPATGPAPLTVTLSSAGSQDPDGQPLAAYRWVLPDGSVRDGASAVVTLDGHGWQEVGLQVRDQEGAWSSVRANLLLNAPPVMTVTTRSVAEDTTLDIAEVFTDSDDAWASGYIHVAPQHGTARLDGRRLTYTPSADYAGTDRIGLRLSDGYASLDATLSIQVVAVADPPRISGPTQTWAERGQPRPIVFTASDPEGEALSWQIAAGPSLGTITGSAPHLTYQAATTGDDAVTVLVRDASGQETSHTCRIAVRAPLATARWEQRGGDAGRSGTAAGAVTGLLSQGWNQAFADPMAATLVGDGRVIVAPQYASASTAYWVAAHDAATGAQLWRRTFAGSRYGQHPILTGGQVVVASGTSYLQLDAATGATVRTQAIPTCDTWGATAFWNDRVLVPGLGARRLADGAAAWPGDPRLVAGDCAVEVNSNGVTLRLRRLDDGTEATRFALGCDGVLGTAAGLDGVVVVASSSRLVAVDTAQRMQRWSVSGAFTYGATPAIGQGLVFIPAGSVVEARSLATGALVRSYACNDATIGGQCLLTPDRLLVPGAATVHIFDLAVTTSPVQRIPVGGPLAWDGSRLVIAHAQGVACWRRSGAGVPTARAASVSGDEDQPLPIVLTGSDPDGDALTFRLTRQPISGRLTGTPPNLTYWPNQDAHGTDSLRFTVSDGVHTSSAATVSITIRPINDAPVVSPLFVTTISGQTRQFTVPAQDADGQALTLAIAAAPTAGTAALDGSVVTYVPQPGFVGNDTCTITAHDGLVAGSPATMTLRVLPGVVGKMIAPDGMANDRCGSAVAIAGDWCAVGAPMDMDASGSVHLYRRAGADWRWVQRLARPAGLAAWRWGASLAMRGDALVVSGLTTGGATAVVFRRDADDTWRHEASLAAPGATGGNAVTAAWVDIDGDTVVLGLPYDGAGAVVAFARGEAGWSQVQRWAGTTAEGRFGWDVSVSGDRIAWGAFQESGGATQAGAVYVVQRTGAAWSDPVRVQPTGLAAADWFGYAVELDGDRLVAAAPMADAGTALESGCVYAYAWDGAGWSLRQRIANPAADPAWDQFGRGLALAGDRLLIGAPYQWTDGMGACGTMQIFAMGAQWTHAGSHRAPDGADQDWLGEALAADGDLAIAGVALDDDLGSASGSAYVVPVSTLPAGWRTAGIGGGVGWAVREVATGDVLVGGTAGGIGASADAVCGAWRALAGDADVTVRVPAVPPAGTTVGLTIRDGLAAGGRMAALMYGGDRRLHWIRRTQPDAMASDVSWQVATAPWLRLTRRGNRVTALRSLDGVTWTTCGGVTLALPAAAEIGVVAGGDAVATRVADLHVEEPQPVVPSLVRINFQPQQVAVPTGWLVADGAAVAPRWSGLTFGFSTTTTAAADRNSSRAVDQLHDTLVGAPVDRSFAVDLPNGRYAVTVCVGDALGAWGHLRPEVQGQRVLTATATTDERWFTGTVEVTVTDGRLVLSCGAGATVSRWAWVEILPAVGGNG